MPNSRREFLQSSVAVAAGLMSGAATKLAAAEVTTALSSVRDTPAQGATVQVPKMKFGNVEISRMVFGVNPLYGFSHFNKNFSGAMKEFYTSEKVCEVLHRANSFESTRLTTLMCPAPRRILPGSKARAGRCT